MSLAQHPYMETNCAAIVSRAPVQRSKAMTQDKLDGLTLMVRTEPESSTSSCKITQ